MKHILVTGGAGFIGAYIVRELINNGYKVVIVDTLRDVGGISYIHPKAEFLNMDICDLNLFDKLRDYTFEAVYHLAAQSAGEPSYDNPKFDALTNSYGTLLIAKFCKENNIPKLIYTSTVAVYGNTNEGSLNENSPIVPDSIYGVSKYAGELYVKQNLRNSNTNFTIFRVFNTYGPGENLAFSKKGMVSIYISYLWKKEPILVKGSLDRYRDFTFIDDTVKAILLSQDSNISNGKTYNLSSGIKTTVKELLDQIFIAFGEKVSYPVKEMQGTPGDSFGFHADISKLNEELSWYPATSLEKGLKYYADWVKCIPSVESLSSSHPFKID